MLNQVDYMVVLKIVMDSVFSRSFQICEWSDHVGLDAKKFQCSFCLRTVLYQFLKEDIGLIGISFLKRAPNKIKGKMA